MAPSENEAALKRDLALGCQVLAAQGQVDAIFGHLSGRLPGWERFWMKPAGIGLEEVHEEDLVLLDFEGRILAGQRPRHEEFPIHAEIMRTRPEVMAVVHTHPRHSVALSARGSELRPVGHEGSFFSPPGVPIFDQFTDLVRTREQGQAVAAALGECRAIFLRNHGIAVPGSSVAEACCAAIILERAAEVQLLAQPTADAPILYTPDDEARRKRAIWYPEQDPHLPERIRVLFDYYVRALPKP